MRRTAPAVAFVVHHAYCDALACFREPMRYFASAGWDVDLYIGITAQHLAPTFDCANVRVLPTVVSPAGALRLMAALVRRRPRYTLMLTAPTWALYWATRAARLTGTPVGYISDEIIVDRDLTSPSEHKWKVRERAAHRQCAFTIALSAERGEYLRGVNGLTADHPIFIVPNAPSGPARRLDSHYYRDALSLPTGRPIALHAGGMGWKPLHDLIEQAVSWEQPDAPLLVCQGRLGSQLRDLTARGGVHYASTPVPSALLDYVVSSADVGLALYDSGRENDRLMGTASGKLCQYLKNGIPVVVSDLPCFAWVEREGCGVLARSVDQVRPAIARAYAARERLGLNGQRYFTANLDFQERFRPVAAFVEELALRQHAVSMSFPAHAPTAIQQ